MEAKHARELQRSRQAEALLIQELNCDVGSHSQLLELERRSEEIKEHDQIREEYRLRGPGEVAFGSYFSYELVQQPITGIVNGRQVQVGWSDASRVYKNGVDVIAYAETARAGWWRDMKDAYSGDIDAEHRWRSKIHF